jgi:hypothetical protein
VGETFWEITIVAKVERGIPKQLSGGFVEQIDGASPGNVDRYNLIKNFAQPAEPVSYTKRPASPFILHFLDLAKADDDPSVD